MALLHATWRAARDLAGQGAPALPVHALHVHHGLSRFADDWCDHCARQCERWRAEGADLHFHVRHLGLRPQAGESLEALAREGRYRALADMAREAGCRVVLLAHHRDDQAETFLLQALRGAGAAGLAAMPRAIEREGLRWLRPWLARPRAEIEAYVAAHRIAHVDDDSNADPRHARNRLRLQVMPALREAFPQAPLALADAAARAQDAAECLDALAELDLEAVRDPDGLALQAAALAALSPARRRNLLRCWLAGQGVAVRASWLERLAVELPQADSGAVWPLDAARMLRLHRGRLALDARGEPSANVRSDTLPDEIALAPLLPPGLSAGQALTLALPGWSGRLHLEPVAQGGLAWADLAALVARPRRGGEQFQSHAAGVPRALKKQFQAAGVPAWLRDAPLLWRGERLVCVPALGVDAREQAPPGAPQWRPRWAG